MVNCMEGGLPETIEELDFTRMRKVGFVEGLMLVWAMMALHVVGNRRGRHFRKNTLLAKKKIHNNNKNS